MKIKHFIIAAIFLGVGAIDLAAGIVFLSYSIYAGGVIAIGIGAYITAKTYNG